ncbi:hypothetical protein L1987_57932 [Smallanthus sonchifolius]|uniref:Uncharacterized protein n=1 Tax=Smallanthus sonchifolius TaxID=185202 RepID=A0ACB9DDY3_9ASTR|nr:hypothetical protein L1987_57932 [Smallanthus sonchifolius]
MDDVQITVTEGEAQVPPPGKSSALDPSSDEFYINFLQDHEVSCDTLHLSCENESVQVIRDEDTIKEEQRKVQDIMNTRWHLITKAEKFHLLDEFERLMDELANLRLAKDKAAPEPGTLTEEGDDEIEIEESSDDTMGDSPGKYSEPELESEDGCIKEGLPELDEQEEELEEEQVPSWESEFGDEFGGPSNS